MRSSATISDCGQYRYALRRQLRDVFTGEQTVGFIMLNPSTADATVDDPTIRRLIGFAKVWGMDSLEVANLYALRSPDPKALWQHDDPVGPENDWYIERLFRRAAAWSWRLGVPMPSRTTLRTSCNWCHSAGRSTASARPKVAHRGTRCT